MYVGETSEANTEREATDSQVAFDGAEGKRINVRRNVLVILLLARDVPSKRPTGPAIVASETLKPFSPSLPPTRPLLAANVFSVSR